MYIVIYARLKGLIVITVAMMRHWEIQLGGWNWHKRFCVPVYRGNNMSAYKITQLCIHKIERFPSIIEFIWSINIIANEKIGQSPAGFDNVIDSIFKVVWNMNVHKEKKFSWNIRPKTTPLS